MKEKVLWNRPLVNFGCPVPLVLMCEYMVPFIRFVQLVNKVSNVDRQAGPTSSLFI